MSATLVQSASAALSGTSSPVSWGAATGAGRGLYAFLGFSTDPGVITPPAGGWVQVDAANAGGVVWGAVYYIENAASQSGAQMWSWVNAIVSGNIITLEYSGVIALASLDSHNTASGGPVTTCNSANVTPSQGNELVLFFVAASGIVTFSAPVGGYTIEKQASTVVALDQTINASANPVGSVHANIATTYVSFTATFILASAQKAVSLIPPGPNQDDLSNTPEYAAIYAVQQAGAAAVQAKLQMSNDFKSDPIMEKFGAIIDSEAQKQAAFVKAVTQMGAILCKSQNQNILLQPGNGQIVGDPGGDVIVRPGAPSRLYPTQTNYGRMVIQGQYAGIQGVNDAFFYIDASGNLNIQNQAAGSAIRLLTNSMTLRNQGDTGYGTLNAGSGLDKQNAAWRFGQDGFSAGVQAASAFQTGTIGGQNYGYGFCSGDIGATLPDTAIDRVAFGAVQVQTWTAGQFGFFKNPAPFLASDFTNATNTLNPIGPSVTLAAGRTYRGVLFLMVDQSTAAEGVQFDFAGGTCTATTFKAAAGVLASGGTDTIGTNTSTTLAGVINFTVLTGGANSTCVLIFFSITVNAGGTLQPRAAENSPHVTGTVTVRAGSYMAVEDIT